MQILSRSPLSHTWNMCPNNLDAQPQWDFVTKDLYRTVTDLYILFYVRDKVVLYLLLVERAHQIRKSNCARYEDLRFILCVTMVFGGIK